MAPFCDAFTLARIAGHSSITITQRYCHPQADAVEAAFLKFGNRSEVVTKGGHRENRHLAERSETEVVTGA
jgi:heat shock protein HslJ